jgi:hypothetical protein
MLPSSCLACPIKKNRLNWPELELSSIPVPGFRPTRELHHFSTLLGGREGHKNPFQGEGVYVYANTADIPPNLKENNSLSHKCRTSSTRRRRGWGREMVD